MTDLSDRLGRGLVIGIEIASASPSAVELVGGLGFHLGVVDARHAGVSVYSLEHERLVRAADASGLAVVTRIPENTPGTINRVLNDGASGVLVACDDAVQAERAASSMRYPPLGFRGAAPVVRAAQLGLTPWDEYRTTTNAAKPLLVSIEHDGALARIDEIASARGVDAVVLDLPSLSQDAGRVVRTPDDHTPLRAAIETIRDRGRTAGVLLAGEGDGSAWVSLGATLIVLGTDLAAYAASTLALRRSLDAVPSRIGAGS